MKHPNVAITTSPYYLDKSSYCVKILKVSVTKAGVYKWYVSRIIGLSADRNTCISEAQYIAARFNLIYVPYAVHGGAITKSDMSRLETHGLLSRQKYSTKELPWD